MPSYFVSGYDGMDSRIRGKEKRSSGEMKKDDLLFLAKVSDDFSEIYFKTLIFFKKNYGVASDYYDNNFNFSSSSSSSSSDSEDDELTRIMNSLNINNNKLNTSSSTELSIICHNYMSLSQIYNFEREQERERGQWICIHIMSFGPIKKEYKALYSLVNQPCLPICKVITSGKIDSENNIYSYYFCYVDNYTTVKEEIIQEHHLNESQASILGEIKDKRLSLVQGPPGTGKTTMIIALIDLITRVYRNQKILVCAPSNYACDEIARPEIFPSNLLSKNYFDDILKQIENENKNEEDNESSEEDNESNEEDSESTDSYYSDLDLRSKIYRRMRSTGFYF